MARYPIAFMMLLACLIAPAQPLTRAEPKPINAAGGGSLTMAWTYATNYTVSGLTYLVVPTNNPTAGGLLIVRIAGEVQNRHPTGITDVQGNAWTLVTNNPSAGSSGSADIWKATASASTANNITVTFSSGPRCSISVNCITGQTGVRGVGAEVAQATPNVSYNPASGSIVLWVTSDWNAANGARTYRNSETEIDYNFQSGLYTGIHAQKTGVSSGSQSWGITATSDASNGYATCLAEIN